MTIYHQPRAWLHQGIYGKMTHMAQEYHISRTFLYQLMWAADLQLETLFSGQKPEHSLKAGHSIASIT